MAKIYGLFGAMSGKVADVVMSVRNGQQIVRKYQPVVKNPQTENQYTTRARFKLLSQLSAILATAIAFRKNGGVSGRNKFTKANFPLTFFANDKAQINTVNVDLTGGVRRLPAILVQQRTGSQVDFSLSGSPDSEIDGVVYAVVTESAEGVLGFDQLKVVTTAGVDGHYASTVDTVSSNIGGYILAYGFKLKDETTRSRFSNIRSDDAVAFVEVLRSQSEDYVTLTETKGAIFQAVSAGREEETKKVSKK